MANLHARALIGVIALTLGCAPTPSAATTAAEAPLHQGPLSDFVPAAGLRWLVLGSPRELAASPALATLRERWLTETRREAFTRMTGVDLWATERALAAGFDLGTLYMADASGWVALPDEPFAARLAGSERIDKPHPRIWRIDGVAGTQPETLVRVDEALVAVAVGDPTLARVVELRARERLERVAPALDGVSLGALPRALREPRALAVYVPGPLDEQWVAAGSSLLANTQALVLTLDLASDNVLLGVALAGHWQAATDEPRLREAWRALGATELGKTLGLDRPLEPAVSAGSETLLRVRTQLDGSAFAAGLERLFAAPLADLTF